MTKALYLPVTLLLLCLIGCMACSQQRLPCLNPVTASLIVNTVHMKTDTSSVPVDSSLPKAAFYPLSNEKNDTSRYQPSALFTLTLAPDSTFCEWIYSANSAQPFDTLSFYYRRRLEFISNACGFTYYFDLDSVRTTHWHTDSVVILNTSVNDNVNTKHLQIYIHPNY